MSNTIYDIDYNKLAVQLLPPDKRYTKQVAWVRILLSVLQYLRDLWFGSYRTGSTAPIWVNTSPYAKYDQVIYSNKIVYESLIDSNSELPTNTAAWIVVQQNFIGLSERILYNGQKLVLEWAMNKWFGTTFRQPPNTPDIYISNNSLAVASFRDGLTESVSSTVGLFGSSEYIGLTSNYTVAANFAIYCPVAVFNALDPTLINNEKIFRAFVDLYVAAGVTYEIITY